MGVPGAFPERSQSVSGAFPERLAAVPHGGAWAHERVWFFDSNAMTKNAKTLKRMEYGQV